MIANNCVTILSGDTGCGKSTQVPQFILDDEVIGPGCYIIVTQPRRIRSTSIVERVAAERCEGNGNGKSSVSAIGYKGRMEVNTSPSTQVLFLTLGVLLRKLQSLPSVLEYTHVIIDEIHERDKYTEFLMIALRQIMTRDASSKLHLVLMSVLHIMGVVSDEHFAGAGGSGGGLGRFGRVTIIVFMYVHFG